MEDVVVVRSELIILVGREIESLVLCCAGLINGRQSMDSVGCLMKGRWNMNSVGLLDIVSEQ